MVTIEEFMKIILFLKFHQYHSFEYYLRQKLKPQCKEKIDKWHSIVYD